MTRLFEITYSEDMLFGKRSCIYQCSKERKYKIQYEYLFNIDLCLLLGINFLSSTNWKYCSTKSFLRRSSDTCNIKTYHVTLLSDCSSRSNKCFYVHRWLKKEMQPSVNWRTGSEWGYGIWRPNSLKTWKNSTTILKECALLLWHYYSKLRKK